MSPRDPGSSRRRRLPALSLDDAQSTDASVRLGTVEHRPLPFAHGSTRAAPPASPGPTPAAPPAATAGRTAPLPVYGGTTGENVHTALTVNHNANTEPAAAAPPATTEPAAPLEIEAALQKSGATRPLTPMPAPADGRTAGQPAENRPKTGSNQALAASAPGSDDADIDGPPMAKTPWPLIIAGGVIALLVLVGVVGKVLFGK